MRRTSAAVEGSFTVHMFRVSFCPLRLLQLFDQESQRQHDQLKCSDAKMILFNSDAQCCTIACVAKPQCHKTEIPLFPRHLYSKLQQNYLCTSNFSDNFWIYYLGYWLSSLMLVFNNRMIGRQIVFGNSVNFVFSPHLGNRVLG